MVKNIFPLYCLQLFRFEDTGSISRGKITRIGQFCSARFGGMERPNFSRLCSNTTHCRSLHGKVGGAVSFGDFSDLHHENEENAKLF